MVYDLIVIGGGPAGYRAAELASEKGLSVLLIEERRVGGTCLNEGCIPTKALLYSAKLFDGAAHGEKYGVTAEGLSFDHGKAVKRKDKVVKTLVLGVQSALRNAGVTLVNARAVVKAKTNESFAVEAGGETYEGKRLLVAAGSVTAVPPIPGLKEGLENGFVVTNREILALSEPPKRLVVIGGGVIGLELASYFCSVGSEVTVIEMLDHIAGSNDADLVSILQKNYEKKGVRFLLSAKVTSVENGCIHYEKDGAAATAEADCALLSIGRRAAAAGLGLETIGVNVERGAVPTNEYMETNVPDVYAAGDVNGKSLLAHTAYREAEVAVNRMLGVGDEMRYDAIPAVIYTNPELGTVGETAATAAEKGLDVKVTQLPMRFSGRYLAENEGGDGVVKLVTDGKTGRVLGCQMLSNYASEIIVTVGLAIEKGMTAEELTKTVFPHPTVGEALREAAFQAVKGE